MIQDIAPHIYHNEFSADKPAAEDYVLIFGKKGLLCRVTDGVICLPTVAQLGAPYGESLLLFSIDNHSYCLWEQPAPEEIPGWQWQDTRGLRNLHADETLFACAAAESLYRWYDGNRFCGRCGGSMVHGTKERSQVCSVCGNTVYPKICPAVIVAVHDGDRLLLTRYQGRSYRRYALVAGYNEIGETIEETVHREVMEEVGLRVKNLRFYKSQPWVFTDTLLMGFYAELDGSDRLTVQEDELSEALWLHRKDIPQDYSMISLTGEMIEQFRLGNR